jgi:hypothetical protein
VLIKKESVRCVERKLLTQKATNNLPLDNLLCYVVLQSCLCLLIFKWMWHWMEYMKLRCLKLFSYSSALLMWSLRPYNHCNYLEWYYINFWY